MQNYRDDADTDVVGGSAPADRVVEGRPSQKTMSQKLESMRLDYGLDLEVTAGNPHEDPKSVKEEYSLYIAQVSPKDTDILKFWEVRRTWRTGDACEKLLTGLPRSTGAPSPYSPRLRWTTSPSRRRPSRVNGFSRPAPNPTLSDEIASAPC